MFLKSQKALSGSALALPFETPAETFSTYRCGQRDVVGRKNVQAFFEDLQGRICAALEEVDGQASFQEDRWSYDGGGGGKTRILQNGGVFEKAGVNFSAIEGSLPATVAAKMQVETDPFFATGVSLVIRPLSPMAPTIHMNVRYFEQSSGKRWFGGGMRPHPLLSVHRGHPALSPNAAKRVRQAQPILLFALQEMV